MGGLFGKYRALVVDNRDPQHRGRVLVAIPEILGPRALWALWAPVYTGAPVVPVAPPVGATLLVEFLGGEAEAPVWGGHFLPKPGNDPVSGETLIEAPDGARVRLGPEGIEIAFGEARLVLDRDGIRLSGLRIALDGHDVRLGEGPHAPLVDAMKLINALGTHIHSTADQGGPSGPPVMPLNLQELLLTKVTAA